MLKSMPVLAGLFVVWLAMPAAAAEGIDLQEKYPPTLDVSPQSRGYEWTCDKTDVWRLKDFSFRAGDDFKLELKSAQLVVGHHESCVLWAVVIPDQPGELVKAAAGQGEHVTSVWLRFHPARLREFFPPETVVEQGDAPAVAVARRLAAHKLRNSWQANGLPMVPAREAVTVDVETREGPRRFFAIDTGESEVTYFDDVRERPLPAARKIDREAALRVFDIVWDAFDREYAMFVVKPEVDWSKLRDEFRPRAAEATENFQLAELLAEMLAQLKDLHVAVRVDRIYVPVFDRRRPLNANRKALPRLAGNITVTSSDLSSGITDDGVGYIAINRLADRKLPQQFVDVLERMDKTRGLIVDLRYNGGGDESLAQEIAGSFVDRERVYAQSQIRNGPRHADLGLARTARIHPKDPWHYVGPVVVLQGQRTMSSAESFVLMLAQCPQVTTMGDRTAGSSGNPRQLDAGEGIVVSLPRWNPLDAEGKPFDGIGIPPAVAIDAADDAFQDEGDPVLEAALQRLRAADNIAGDVLQLRPGATKPRDRPRVVAVTPADNADRINPVTEIRIRFDRPMNAENFRLRWHPANGDDTSSVGFRLRGPIQYNPENNEFVFPVQLTSAATHRIQLAAERSPGASNHREFLSADGAEALPHTWEFRTRELRPQENGQKVAGIEAGSRAALNGPDDIARESARITEAGTAEPLRRLVARVRERRRALKSLVETVRDRSYTTNQPWWFHTLEVERSARFWWQGKAQFRADASRFFFPGVPLLVGGDDRRCWSRIGEQFVTAAADAIAVKNVFFGDPLFAARDLTDEAIIGEMKLEYLGEEQYGDANCYRLRSWTFRPASENSPARFDFHDWLIDAKTLLPVVYEEFSSGAPLRFEFNYERIDEELPAEIFEPPTDTGIEPVDPEPLGEGFDKYFLNAMDGSAGRISVRWGKTGKRGTHSSGLN